MPADPELRRRVRSLSSMSEEDAEAEWERLGKKYGPTPGDLEGPGGARASDPSTSARAAESIAVAAENYRGIALQAIYEKRPFGLTNCELVEVTKIDGIWKRTSELERDGLIEAPGHERRCESTGKMNRVYVCTEAGEALAREMAA